MTAKVQKVTEPLRLGEGPHWDARAQALYFVDIISRSLHKYVPSTGKHTQTKLDSRPGFIIPVEGTTNQYVVAMERRFQVLQWDGEEGSPATLVKDLGEVDPHLLTGRINDGKVDPRGRLFAGTMDHREDKTPNIEHAGSLYRVEGSTITKVEQGITVANGLSWDLQEKAFYYTDTMEYKIRRYDYDIETGEISNLRYIFDFKAQGLEGFPDGHTIDTNGNLWVAVFGSSCVMKIDPRRGKVLRKVQVPAPQVTSATFGGPNLDVLYVTTAGESIFDEQKYPAGSVFAVTGLGVRGHPNHNFILN